MLFDVQLKQTAESTPCRNLAQREGKKSKGWLEGNML